MSVCGIVLAAGAGSRYGHPKALAVRTDGTAWVAHAVRALAASGCDPILVVVGACRDEVTALVPESATIVVAKDWADGLSASVRAGLAAAAKTHAAAALVVPVDMPELPASACNRVKDQASADSLRQATYGGEAGHPALLGRSHWDDLARTLTGDRGAGTYLREHGVDNIECGDLWHGRDVDRAEASPGRIPDSTP